MAPEIIRIRVYREFRNEFCFEYNPFRADIWALGICLFELVTSHLPFNVIQDKEFLRLQNSRSYRYPKNCNLSQDCRDLIDKMIDPNPESRADPFCIEHHVWLTNNENSLLNISL